MLMTLSILQKAWQINHAKNILYSLTNMREIILSLETFSNKIEIKDINCVMNNKENINSHCKQPTITISTNIKLLL